MQQKNLTKLVISIIALLAAGGGIYAYTNKPSTIAPYIKLSLTPALSSFSRDAEIQIGWSTNIPDKKIFISIDPEQGKTKFAQLVENTGEYKIRSLDIGPGGKYEINVASPDQSVTASLPIEISYEKEAINGLESANLGGGYFADKIGVFYLRPDQRLTLNNSDTFFANPWLFNIAGEGTAFQDGGYFIHNKKFNPQLLELPNYQELKIISDYISILFSYGDKILWTDEQIGSFQILGDASTFRFVSDKSNEYFVVGKMAYLDDGFTLTELKGVDAQTFEFAGDCSYIEKSRGYYMKDKYGVSFGTKIISHDPTHFIVYKVDQETTQDAEIPAGAAYAKDLKKVYYSCDNEVVGADPGSFEYLGNGNAKDAHSIYRFGAAVKEAAPAQ